MKQLITFTCLGLSLMLSSALSYSQAVWNGSQSGDWLNAINWTWPNGGSGVPNEQHNVIIPTGTPNSINITGGLQVSCNNLTFGNNPNIVSNGQLFLSNGSGINLSGNINSNCAEGSSNTIISLDPSNPGTIDNTTTVNFGGSDVQTIEGVKIVIGNSIFNNDSGVTINRAQLFVIDTLRMNATPVANGLDANGCITIDTQAVVYVDPAKLKIPYYTTSQTPPHFITNFKSYFNNGQDLGGLVLGKGLTSINNSGVSGSITVPVGPTAKAYNQMLIISNQPYIWAASARRTFTSVCAGEEFTSHSIRNYYDLNAATVSNGAFSPVEELVQPITVLFTYSSNPTVADINSNFDPNASSFLWEVTSDCLTKIPNTNSSPNNNYVSIFKQSAYELGTFIISQKDTINYTAPQSVTVSVANNQAPEITQDLGTLQMQAEVLPAGTQGSVTWSITPVTGSATISNTGLVSATGNGSVWAKASVNADTSLQDSMFIIISNQYVELDSIDVIVANGGVPNIEIDGGTLQLAVNSYPNGAENRVTWALNPIYGTATIDTNGLVTAISNASIWAIATSVENTSITDSLLFSVSNQNNTSIADQSDSFKINIYPNPAKNHLFIQLKEAHPKLTITISNILGTVLSKSRFSKNELNTLQKIAIKSLQAGSYILSIEGDNIQHQVKFIKK